MSEVKDSIREIDNELRALEDIETRMNIASESIESAKDEKERRKSQLAKKKYESDARHVVERLLGLAETLRVANDRQEEESTDLEEKLDQVDGLLMIETKAKLIGSPNEAEIVRLEKEKNELVKRKETLQGSLKEISSTLDRIYEARERILGPDDKPKSPPMTPEQCAQRHHPMREKRRRSGHRGDIVEFWYCPMCKRKLEPEET